MKKKLLFAAMAVTALFVSCSDDDATANSTQDTSMDLVKTVKYIPTKEAYENNAAGSKKNVQYFEANRVIADTTFDASGNITMRIINLYTVNTHIMQYVPNGLEWDTKNYVFDNLGRIIEERIEIYGSTNIKRYVYNPDNVTINYYDPGTNELMPQYTMSVPTNSLGQIMDNNVTYQGDMPIQWNFGVPQNSATVNLEYYNVNMPANLLKTVTGLNNLYLQSRDSRISLAENNNYHLKRYIKTTSPVPSTTIVNFEKTFNELGYVTYSKAEGTIYESVRDSETFYYYE